MKTAAQMNVIQCYEITVTEKENGITHRYSADTAPDALWLYNQMLYTCKYSKVRLVDSTGCEWVLGLRVEARLMKQDEKPIVIFEDPEVEKLHSKLFMEL